MGDRLPIMLSYPGRLFRPERDGGESGSEGEMVARSGNRNRVAGLKFMHRRRAAPPRVLKQHGDRVARSIGRAAAQRITADDARTEMKFEMSPTALFFSTNVPLLEFTSVTLVNTVAVLPEMMVDSMLTVAVVR